MAKVNETKQARILALILTLLFLGFAAISYYRDHPGRAAAFAGVAVVVALVAALAWPLWLRFFRGWMVGAAALGWVMTRVILSVFFLLVLTPVSLVMRLTGKRPLDTRFRDGRPSYWRDKPALEPSLARYERRY